MTIDQYKGHLAPKGLPQKYGIDYLEIFSPIVRNSTIRLLFAMAVEFNLDIDHVDTSAEFLNEDRKKQFIWKNPNILCM